MKNLISIKDCGILNDVLNYCSEIISEKGEEAYQEIMNLVQTVRVTMIMKTNRLQSLYLCEMLQSYSIQSQRYVQYNGDLEDNIIFNGMESFSEGEQKEIRKVLENCRRLYLDMSELKPESINKAKFKIDDFKYGIPIEDARYILPLAFNCNKEVTFEGIHFFELIRLFLEKKDIFQNMFEMIMDEIIRFLNSKPENENLTFEAEYAIRKIIMYITKNTTFTTRVLPTRFFDRYGKPDEIHRVNLLVDTVNQCHSMQKTGAAALMCTSNENDPEKIFNSKTNDQFKRITERVSAENHHTSISEHASYTLLMKMTVCCYNQYVRARHQQCIREDFNIEFTNNIIMPQTINKSIFELRFTQTVRELFMLIVKLTENTENLGSSERTDSIKSSRLEYIKQLFPMSTELRVLCTTNLVNELINKGPKRLCNNAQWEIRTLSREVISIISNDFSEDGNSKLLATARPGCCTPNGCREGKGRCKDNSNVLRFFGLK